MIHLDLNVGTLLIIMVVCLILYSYVKCDCSQLELYRNVYFEPYENIGNYDAVYVVDDNNPYYY
jgi:hypothetical protein